MLLSGMVGAMQARFSRAKRADVSAIVFLAALIFRAYIPVGFMPASGTPFLLDLCPAYAGGAPAYHAHHHHSQDHAGFQNCPFGSTPAQGPVSHLIAIEPPGRIPSLVAAPPEQAWVATQPTRSHQPRGPPPLT